MSKFTYLLVDLGSIIIPFIFSFHPKLGFNKKWRSTLLAISIVAAFFIGWDIYFTEIGVWGFNSTYLIGVNILNLPIEEILFFVCIPYACLFTYHCFKVLLPAFNFPYFKVIIPLIISMLFVLGCVFIDNWYTSVVFISSSLTLIYFQFIVSMAWLKRAFFASLFLIIPFIIVNGILTGTGIDSEVVWYNPTEIMGYRLLTIPLEDFSYGFLLILFNIYFFEKFDYLNSKPELNLKP